MEHSLDLRRLCRQLRTLPCIRSGANAVSALCPRAIAPTRELSYMRYGRSDRADRPSGGRTAIGRGAKDLDGELETVESQARDLRRVGKPVCHARPDRPRAQRA